MSVLKILLLAHDLSDPAIHRRVRMLKEGSGEVSIAGFHRSSQAITDIDSCPTIDFGQTHNGAFLQRIFAVLKTVFTLRQHRALFTDADIILARNLEMLAIAVRGKAIARNNTTIIYEALDIHRLLLAKNLIGRSLRGLETWLVRRCAGLMTSSPAFITNYFQRFAERRLPIRLVENKILDIDGNLPAPLINPHLQTTPWKIGWFGIIRCRKSLAILQKLVQQNTGTVEVVIRGRPALDQIPDFHDIIAATPGLNFLGAYKNPDDLAAMYGSVHFVWAIDMYEEGQNSAWLLPNRIYEGGYYGAVPLAIDGVETGNFVQRLKIGHCLQQPLTDSLQNFFAQLTPETYQTMEKRAQEIPTSIWVYTQQDCQGLIEWMQALQKAHHG